MILSQYFSSDDYGDRSNLLCSVICITISLVITLLFLQVCALRSSSLEPDSTAKVFLDVIPYLSFSLAVVFAGYYFLEKYFNPDKQLFEPKVTNWQMLVLKFGTTESRSNLIQYLAQIAFHKEKSKHVLWFQILLSTNKHGAEINSNLRHKKVLDDLEKKEVKIRSQLVCKRIAQTMRYSELEAWLPSYILQAADQGDLLAKQIAKCLPIKTRFFWKKDRLFLNM